MPLLLRCCLLLIALVPAFASQAVQDSPIRSINVTYDGETYVCDAVILAPVQPLIAWEVLTDFEHMAEWVPNVRKSTVLKLEGSSATIEQQGLAKFGAVTFAYTTERRMELNKPIAIRAAQVRGDLERFESLLTLDPEAKGTRLTYHLEVVPGFLAGAVVSKSFFEREIAEQFGAIVGEMARRAR